MSKLTIIRQERERIERELAPIEEARSYNVIALRDAALCLGCESIFNQRHASCPHCTSRQHLALARVLDTRAAS